jgi:hypothetical protein
MNKDKLFSLMPTEVITEDDVNNRIEKQRGIIKAGKSFVSQLSINRFLHKKLAEFDIGEIINLFSDLTCADFVINENSLYLSEIDIDSFAAILEEKFNLENMYEIDNFYIENLLNGRDITKEDININGENISFADVLLRFAFHTSRMSMGDTPNLVLMLTVKRALLGSYLAEKNVECLLNGQREIYDISILM